jgi:hypothetical protein
MSIESLWQEIAGDPARPATGYLSRRVGIDAPCDMRAAIEFPAGLRVLLIGVPSGPLARAGKLPRSAGIEVSQVSMPQARQGQATVAVRLTDARYADIFTVVGDDLTRHLGRAADGPAAAEALMSRLRKWQQFLDKTPPDGLGPIVQQGLYGELRLLSTLIGTRIGARATVEAWVGPQAANQDFQFPSAAVEVKTTTSKMHQTLEIASERQLDPVGVVHLFLFHLSLDERPGGGDTLPALVDAIRSSIISTPVVAETFESRLLDAGYLDIHAPLYFGTGYTVRQMNFFRVSGDFPRIIEADLRTGVGAVRYSVSVAACAPYGTDEAAVIDAITEALP